MRRLQQDPLHLTHATPHAPAPAAAASLRSGGLQTAHAASIGIGVVPAANQAAVFEKKTPGHDSARYLKHEICVAQSVRLHLCRQAVRVTGGMGRMLQYLLRALQQAAGERLRAETEADVDAAIEQARLRVSSDLELRITWDGPADDAADVPVLLQGESTKRQLLRLFARALLLDAPFSPDLEIRLGHDTKVCFSDAAVVLGFSYMPVATLPGTVSDHDSDDDTVADGESGSAIVGTGAGFLAVSPPSPQPERLKLVAGEWLCRSLATDPRIAADPALLVTAQRCAILAAR